MLEAIKEHLSDADVKTNFPTAGMFMWMEFLKSESKTGSEAGFGSLASFEIFKRLAADGIIAVPGGDFHVPPASPAVSPDALAESPVPVDPAVVRLTFAASSPAQMTEGIKRLAVAMKK